ncbi:E3 ubiquitin-protein ligase MARCHF9-like isoform X2 [Hippocampus zosterae]|uniref:E3 ubiquitin-protein ligase MARCHF9-like isoform X2 n=1 Tax=Hippocampus zosterae TaxID=109293 RepID=UPI00223E81BF|nr:E3 ubiquitin-protein ligase MARCHF9-like isoform X2 [Hippocampus zosterae]
MNHFIKNKAYFLIVHSNCQLARHIGKTSVSSTGSEQRTDTGSSMTGLIGGCSWPPLAHPRLAEQDDVEEKNHQAPGDEAKHLQEDATSFISLAESGMRTPQCRICFLGPDKGELLSPCRCDGSVRFSHQSCLVRWIGETGSWNCELCRFKYQVFSVCTKNPLQWQPISLNLIEKVQITAVILGALFLIASLGWLMWSIVSPFAEFQRQDYIFQILYGMYVFMDFVCIGLLIQEGPSVYRIIKRWHTMNQKWKVLNYEKMKDASRKSAGGEESTTAELPDNGQEPRGRSRSCITLYIGNTILNILNRLRPNNLTINNEVVMRVTTV